MRLGIVIALLVAAPLKPPVIHEKFTPLPCPMHPVSTLDTEGCAEQAILKTDKQIDAQAAAIFKLLPAAYRGGFVRSEQAWLAYRNGTCEAQSGKYAGGTAAGVVAATCTADTNREHLRDLVAFHKSLQSP